MLKHSQASVELDENQAKELLEHFSSIRQSFQNEENIPNGIHELIQLLDVDCFNFQTINFIFNESILSFLMKYQLQFCIPILKIVSYTANSNSLMLQKVFNDNFFDYLTHAIQSADSPQLISKLYKTVIIAFEHGIQNINFIDSIYYSIVEHFQTTQQNIRTFETDGFYTLDSIPINSYLYIYHKLTIRILILMKFCFSLNLSDVHSLFIDHMFTTLESHCIQVVNESLISLIESLEKRNIILTNCLLTKRKYISYLIEFLVFKNTNFHETNLYIFDFLFLLTFYTKQKFEFFYSFNIIKIVEQKIHENAEIYCAPICNVLMNLVKSNDILAYYIENHFFAFVFNLYNENLEIKEKFAILNLFITVFNHVKNKEFQMVLIEYELLTEDALELAESNENEEKYFDFLNKCTELIDERKKNGTW